MRSSTSIILALTAFTGLSQATVLPSYPLLNNGDAYWINQLKTIPVANHIISKRPWGTAPEHCVLTSNDNNFCSPYNLEIFDIYYADVGNRPAPRLAHKRKSGVVTDSSEIVPCSMGGLSLHRCASRIQHRCHSHQHRVRPTFLPLKSSPAQNHKLMSIFF